MDINWFFWKIWSKKEKENVREKKFENGQMAVSFDEKTNVWTTVQWFHFFGNPLSLSFLYFELSQSNPETLNKKQTLSSTFSISLLLLGPLHFSSFKSEITHPFSSPSIPLLNPSSSSSSSSLLFFHFFFPLPSLLLLPWLQILTTGFPLTFFPTTTTSPGNPPPSSPSPPTFPMTSTPPPFIPLSNLFLATTITTTRRTFSPRWRNGLLSPRFVILQNCRLSTNPK